MQLQKFRCEVKNWLQENCPPTMRTPITYEQWPWGGRTTTWPHPDAKKWFEAMHNQNWIAATWPKKYGGGGLSGQENQILQEELKAIKARPPLFSFGLWMLGPVLLKFATEQQKQRFLPPIISGKIRWCQGYSEPDAGSDLASLKTKAQLVGDDFIVNGAKIWTTNAHHCDWIFCLVRTDTTVKKHAGLSLVLIDMESPGVSIRPITLIDGSTQFSAVFFDDVKVPVDNLIGSLNDGWEVAMYLLQYERQAVAEVAQLLENEPYKFKIREVVKKYLSNETEKESLSLRRDELVKLMMDIQCFDLTMLRAVQQKNLTSLASLFKLLGSEIQQRRYETLLKILGCSGLGWNEPTLGNKEQVFTRQWLRSRGNSIEGGTSEIQLNIIAQKILQLPKK
ncbi:acyl-CoA dehydrogenase family protein [Candidatus Uabimicrobium sp. HlEnr_7]|uniref:acyl-CoA dehydrogenase family protein n=1 Tax=Candidatus Uabimicrobium helgolandensis TaxID=3095367 RepID=UPI003555E6BF